jgi:formamidopyrimidine-DNA glycosylase
MPELPEVTTMVNGLRVNMLDKAIIDVWTDREKLIKNKSFPEFKKLLIGAIIIDIFRKGKIICFQLSNEKTLFIHPKMSGHFLVGNWTLKKAGWQANGSYLNKYIHLMFWLDDGLMIAFSDLRQFARIEIWDNKKINQAEIIQKLGTDALEIKIGEFQQILQTSRKKIKQLLMEQSLIAGIGNIYADEILFQAKVHPFRIAKDLTDDEVKKIHQLIGLILQDAIILGGSSISDFFSIEGYSGRFQEKIQVYRRNGKKCLVCQTIIERQKMSNRSTHFCPKCQPKEVGAS